MAFGAMVAASVPQIANADTNKDGDGSFATAGIEWVSVDFWDDMKMRIQPANDKKEVYVGYGKVNKNGNLTVASWDVCEIGNFAGADYSLYNHFDPDVDYVGDYDGYYEDKNSVTNGYERWVKVDLSKLNKAKDNYIVLTTPGEKKENVAIVKLNAAVKGLKAKFDVATGEIWAGSGSASKPSAAARIRCAYRCENMDLQSLYDYSSDGSEMVAANFSGYQMQGTKVFVRFPGYSGETGSKGELFARSGTEVTYGGINIKPYDGITLPSKEVKVSIPARPKAPKAKVNYEKDTVKFPADCEYRLSDGKTITDIKDAGTTEDTIDNITKAILEPANSSGTATPTDTSAATAKIDTTKPFVIEYRKKQTAKKAASRWGIISVGMGAIS